MTTGVRNRNLTLVGLSPNDEAPFPLRPYDASMSFTPSHERSLGTPTPVHIPPARRHTPEQVAETRAYYAKKRRTGQFAVSTPTYTPEPSMLVAASVCIALTLAVLWLVF